MSVGLGFFSGPRPHPHVVFGGRRRSRASRSMAMSSGTGKAGPCFQSLDGIRGIAENGRYKVWLLDQFGVLHDGKKPYPGAISTLESLASSGMKMIILSNSSRRASVTVEKMKTLGFDPSIFLGTITSGELTYQYLHRRDDPWFAKLGRSCIHMTWSDRGAISLEVIFGTLAAKYEKLGGEVRWMGKPDKVIYESAIAMAGSDASECIAVGDSLHHDIKGANAAGIESVFVTGGVHADELGLTDFGQVADTKSIEALASQHEANPSYVVPSFSW